MPAVDELVTIPRPTLLRSRPAPALLALAFAAAFVLYRLALLQSGDVTQSILVGRLNAPGPVGHGVSVMAGTGYDGQFYYRLALDPFHLTGLTNGVHVDSPVRLQRIGYPFLTWLVSGGQPQLVPFALVAVNLVAFATMAGVGGALARSYGRAPGWGLLFCAYAGFAATLSRDLTELLSGALVLTAVLAWRRERPLACGLALAGAVLTRETAVVLVVALFLERLVRHRSAGWRPRTADVSWCLPAAAYAGWQATVAAVTGHLPAAAERGNTSFPGRAPVRAVAHWAAVDTTQTAAMLATVGSLLVLGVLVWHAGRRVPLLTGTAFALAALLTLSLSGSVWNDDPAELRTFMDVHLYGVLALLAAPVRHLATYAAAAAVPFLAVVVYYAGTA